MTIPDYFDDDAGQQSLTNFALIPKDTVIEFQIIECELGMRNYHGQEYEAWKMRLCCYDPVGNITNNIFHDPYIDGLLWPVRDKKNAPWIQNKFIDLCKAVGLRESGSKERPNPMWFTDMRCFLHKKGMAKIDINTFEGVDRNQISWFNDPTVEQMLHNNEIQAQLGPPEFQPPPRGKYFP